MKKQKKKQKKKFTKLQEAWLQALESGDYKQAQGFLCVGQDEKRYCCLGVACEVYNDWAKQHKQRVITSRLVEDEEFYTIDGCEYGLGDRLQEKLMLHSFNGAFVDCAYGSHSLATMNDGGFSHKQIAEYIREHPENVFTNFAKND